MRSKLGMPAPGTVLGGLALIVATSGVAIGAIPGSDGTVQGCVGPNGEMRVIDAEAGATCAEGEHALVLNQRPKLPQPVAQRMQRMLAAAEKARTQILEKEKQAQIQLVLRFKEVRQKAADSKMLKSGTSDEKILSSGSIVPWITTDREKAKNPAVMARLMELAALQRALLDRRRDERSHVVSETMKSHQQILLAMLRNLR